MPSLTEQKEAATALLRQRFPEISLAIERAPSLAAQPSETSPETTLICRGVHLTSCVARRAEAELQAQEVPRPAPAVTVYGLALGDLPRVLLERPLLRELTVVLLNPALFPAANQCSPMTFLADPRVRLVLGRNQTQVVRPFAVAPACLRLAEEAAWPLRDRIQQALSERFQRQNLAHMMRNLGTSSEVAERLARDRDVGELFGSRLGGRAVVVAAGPSLEQELPYLKQVRDQVGLVTVTTALRVLAGAGLTPDFVAAVDRRLELGAHFDGLDLQPFRNTPLIYLAGVHPTVLDRWPGPRFAAFRADSADPDEFPRSPKADLYCSGTVTHAAVDLAVRLGSTHVELLGVDFCFPEGKPHAGEAPLAPILLGAGPSALNGRGAHVPSTLALLGYLRDLESYVARKGNVRFVKRGRDGATLAGVPWQG